VRSTTSQPVWSARQRVKNDVLYCCAAAGLRVGVALPRGWLPWVGRQVGRLAHLALTGARRQARANVALAYPALDAAASARIARGVFLSLGEDLLDTLALLDPDEPAGRTLLLPDASRQILSRALGCGRGVVYATGHLGPWERMAALLASVGFPITTIARESYDPRFHPLVYERLRTARNVQAIYRDQPGASFAMVRTLRKGRVLGFPMDLPGRVPTMPVMLLGQASRLPVGPARIALRTAAPVVVGTPAPGNGGSACLEIRISAIPTGDLHPSEAGERILTQRIADALTGRIEALPTHWPWMHPSFTAPDAAAVRAAVAAAT
jgi:Kdo2-lipid IVA lauroyltransferase/acyltransferase